MAAEGAPTALVGRAAELAQLQDLLDRLARGIGQVALVEGEPGAGKTRLLAEALSDAEARGVSVLHAAADELECDRPLGPLARAVGLDDRPLDEERALIQALLTGDGAHPSPSLTRARELRFRLIDAVVSLVEGLAQRAPILVVIDDLHWADSLTVLTFHQLARRLPHLPLGLVCALRPLPRSDELERVVAELTAGGALHLTLRPLAESDVRLLVQGNVGAPPGPELLRLLARAGGNPFYVKELVSILLGEGAIDVSGDVAEVTRTSAPLSLRSSILRRLGFVSRDTLAVVRIASVLGSSFTVSALATVLGRTPLELVAPLDEAMAAGILGELDDRLAFRHDVVREAVYEGIPLPLRKGLHMQVGRTLAAAGSGPIEVASHLAMGAPTGDSEAVGFILRAARQIGPFAPGRAVDLLRRAVELTEPADPSRDELLVELVWSLVWATHFTEARRVASDVLSRSTDPSVIGMLHYALAKVLQAEGRIADSLRQLEAGLGQPALPDEVRVRLLADLAGRRLHCRDVPGARAAAEEALTEAGRIHSAVATCAALSSLSLLATLQGRSDDAEGLAARATRVAGQDRTGEAARVAPWVFAVFHRIQTDRLDEVDGIVASGRDADETGVIAPLYHALVALARYHEGRWDDAVAEAETSLELSEETGQRVLAMVAYSVLPHVALHRGDRVGARRALDAAQAELEVTGPARFGLPWLLWAQALLLDADGDAPAALALLEGTWVMLRALDVPAECYEMAPDLVRRALSAGRAALAASVTDDIRRLADGLRTRSVRATAARCRGLVEGDGGLLHDALVALRSSPRALERAQAAEDAGEAPMRSDEAASLLREALSGYERLGARHDAARVEAKLRSLGVRTGRRGPRRRPAVGWQSLTSAEQAVARLTVEGLSNRDIGARLFISHRTVATHLTHVFGKLSVSTRAELIAAAARQPEVAGVGASGRGDDQQ